MRRRHRLILSALLLAVAAAGCKEGDKTSAPAAAPAPSESPAATPAAAPVTPAAAPAAPAAPAPPSLGPPPAGVDQLKAFACDKGDGDACLAAAREIEPKGAYRAEMKPEEAEALEKNVAMYAKRACDLGTGEACAMAAHFLRGAEPQRDALEKGCALGDLPSCGHLGWSLSTTGNSLENRKRGIELLEKACRGAAVAYAPRWPGIFCEQAILFLDDKLLRDPAKSKELLALKCQQGSMLDCPCKTDGDCGEDEAYCHEGTCAQLSTD